MQNLDETIVSEYLEQNGFLVRPLRKARLQSKRVFKDEGVDLYIQNLNFVTGAREPSFLLFSSELRYLDKAVVCVRGWHDEKAALASMRDGVEMLKYLDTQVLKKVEKWFDFDFKKDFGLPEKVKKVLVAPTFPMQEQSRRQCAADLRAKGIDGILSFKSMLLDLIDRVNTKEVYPKSDFLQIVRTLKTFDMIKDSQMNFLS